MEMSGAIVFIERIKTYLRKRLPYDCTAKIPS